MLNPAVLVSCLPLVIQQYRMSELGGTLKINTFTHTDKETESQQVIQFLQNLWEGDLTSPSPKFSFVLQSSIHFSPP